MVKCNHYFGELQLQYKTRRDACPWTLEIYMIVGRRMCTHEEPTMPGYIYKDTSGRRSLFFDAWQPKNGLVSMSEKAPASWEAGDILQTRPAELVV